jgi:isovaleryl-CoA dehydrogenase
MVALALSPGGGLTMAEPGGEAHRRLLARLRDFGEREVEPQAARHDRSGTFNRALFARAADLGLLGLTLPETAGGAGLDAMAAVMANHELAKHDPGFTLAYLAHTVLFVHNVFHAAREDQRARLLPPMLRGEWIGAMGMTEPGGGTDVLGMQTTARREGDHYVLRGRKTFITNAPDAACFLVYAKLEGEITTFVVDRGCSGFATGAPIAKMGMRAAPMAELVFDDCRVPAAQLLGRERGGLIQLMRNLEIERLCLAAISLGIAERCLDAMIRFGADDAGSRADDGHFQRLLAESYAEFEAARELVYGVTANVSSDRLNWLEADAAKLFTGPVGKRIADRAVQVMGMAGVCAASTVERFLRDAKLIEIGGGTVEAHHRNIVRELTKSALRSQRRSSATVRRASASGASGQGTA